MIADGLDVDRLGRRLKFLTSRADAHRERGRAGVASAILMRDAGAVALLLGEGELARRLLAQSATELLRLRHPLGLQLAFLSGQKDIPDRDRAARVIWQGFQKRYHQPSSMARRAEYPVRAENLLRMYEGLVGDPMEGKLVDLTASVRGQLERIASASVGSTGIPIGRFLSCIDFVTGVDKPHSTDYLTDPLASMLMRREDAIEAAKRDTYHWRQFLRPAELIDFDFVFLALLAHSRNGSFGPLLHLFQDRDRLSSLPLIAAKLLAGDSG